MRAFLNLERETRLELANPNLGKVVLYQLSYSRMLSSFYKNLHWKNLERETRLELATPTLARLCSTNWAIPA